MHSALVDTPSTENKHNHLSLLTNTVAATVKNETGRTVTIEGAVGADAERRRDARVNAQSALVNVLALISGRVVEESTDAVARVAAATGVNTRGNVGAARIGLGDALAATLVAPAVGRRCRVERRHTERRALAGSCTLYRNACVYV